MRTIHHIVLHCTATPPQASVQSIQNHWRNVLKWNNPGYHYLIGRGGSIHPLQPIERPSNGVAGHNSNSIHISYIGGIDAQGKPIDNRTPRQVLSMIQLIVELKERFPNAKVLGHRDFPNVAKDCPSFDVKTWLTHSGLKDYVLE